MARTSTKPKADADNGIAKLGAQIRTIRKERGLTLKDVAERSELAVSTVSKFESGKLSLSYKRLLDLCESLDIDIRQLFERPAAREQRASKPGDEGAITARRSIMRAGEGIDLASKNNDYQLLFEDILQKELFPAVVRVKARSLEEYGDLTYHKGEEMAFVLKGTVVFHTEHYAPVTLNEGDAVFVDSTMGHGYTTASGREALVLIVMSASIEDMMNRKNRE